MSLYFKVILLKLIIYDNVKIVMFNKDILNLIEIKGVNMFEILYLFFCIILYSKVIC